VKTSFDIEAVAWLTSTGIQTAVYLGHNTDTPQFENAVTFETLIDSALEGCEWSGKFARYHKEEKCLCIRRKTGTGDRFS
jgi:hypothetical protein